jgi:hypothetical protein
MPLVLEALHHGDRKFFEANPELDSSPVFIHFLGAKRSHSKIEAWGVLADLNSRARTVHLFILETTVIATMVISITTMLTSAVNTTVWFSICFDIMPTRAQTITRL